MSILQIVGTAFALFALLFIVVIGFILVGPGWRAALTCRRCFLPFAPQELKDGMCEGCIKHRATD